VNRLTNEGIWIESDLPLSDSSLWSVPLRLVWAVSEGQTTDLGTVSPLLASNLEVIRDIYAAWIDGGRQIPLAFEISPHPAAPCEGVSLFFSGGVDSFYSLIKHRDEVENLILVNGFNEPLTDARTFALGNTQASDAARLFGKRLITAKTNLRWERPSLPPITNLRWEKPSVPGGWFMFHGAALAAIAHALAPIHSKVYIASSYSYANLDPWGSHPLLDPLWSTESVQIVHDGGETRMAKLRVVVQYPEVSSLLRVCTEYQGDFNCGLCEKCIRTMLGLRALGVARCAAFPDTLTPELVRRQKLNSVTVLQWRELLEAGLSPSLQTAVRSAIHSYEAGLPPRNGNLRREVLRLLVAARHSANALMSAAYCP